MEIKNQLIKRLPDRIVMEFASRYVAGDNMNAAISKAKELYGKRGILSTIDVLGEDVKYLEEASHNLVLYKSLIDVVSGSFDDISRPTISAKPSAFTINGGKGGIIVDFLLSQKNLEDFVCHAKQKNVKVTIDMEDHNWTVFTLGTYFGLFKNGFDNIGTVLQTRLDRTDEDVKKFSYGHRVRLCIGIYPESREYATSNKKLMKRRMIEYSQRLLDQGTYVEFATHDKRTIEEFFENVVIKRNIPSHRYEIQNLLGVPLDDYQDEIRSGRLLERKRFENHKDNLTYQLLRENGANLRLYDPFAESWKNAIAYCKRRLKENPDFWLYGIKMVPELVKDFCKNS